MFLLLWAEPLFPPPVLFPVWLFSVLVVRACSSVVSRVNPSLAGLSTCRGGLRWHLPVTPPPLFCLHHSFTMGDYPRQLESCAETCGAGGQQGAPVGRWLLCQASLCMHTLTQTRACCWKSCQVTFFCLASLGGPEVLQGREQLTGLGGGRGQCCVVDSFSGGNDSNSPVAGCGLVENGRQEVQE